MERAQSTRNNDAVTLRQFNRFLKTANLSFQFKGTVKHFKDVVQKMPIILQDLLFAEWISQLHAQGNTGLNLFTLLTFFQSSWFIAYASDQFLYFLNTWVRLPVEYFFICVGQNHI